MNISFKNKYSLHDRYNDACKILEKYPDRIPLICERSQIASYDCPYIDKQKYLVQKDLTIGHFIYVIRKRMNLSPEKAIFLFINGFIPSSSQVLGNLYEYINYSLENTFG